MLKLNLKLRFLSPVIVICALIVSGCAALFGSTFAGCGENLNEIVAMLSPDLPASATVVEQSCVPGFAPGNATLRVKFTIAPDDLSRFIESTPIMIWVDAVPEDYRYDGASVDTEELMYGEYGDGAIRMDVLIDMSDPALYTVYYTNSFID